MTNFDNFFLKYHHILLLYALKFIEDGQQAEDLVQDVFISFWEKGNFNENEEKIKAYLFTAVKNNCLNYLQHLKVIRKYEEHIAVRIKEADISWYMSGEKSLIEQEDLKKIEDAIASLGDIYREVIVLGRVEGLKNSEIAEKLQIPVRTVETRIFRALTMLREKISAKSFFILLYLGELKKKQNLLT